MVAFPIGSEFQVNQTTQSAQSDPEVAVDAQGNFVIAWSSYLFDNDQSAIVARQFHADGTPKGNEIAINSFTPGNQYLPDIATDAAGNFVVAWENLLPNQEPFKDRGMDISARRFSADGKFIDIADTLAIHANTVGDQRYPKVAMNTKNGEYVIAWQDRQDDQSDRPDIRAQRFYQDGTQKGEELIVTAQGADADLAIDSKGNFIVTWSEYLEDSTNLYARYFDNKNENFGEAIKIAPQKSEMVGLASVATDPQGNFVASWSRIDPKNPELIDIYAQKFSSRGEALGNEFLVSSVNTKFQNLDSTVEIDDHGNVIVAWERALAPEYGEPNVSTYDLYAKRFNADGQPIGEEFRVDTFTKEYQEDPSIAIQPEGDFIISWASYAQDGDGEGIFAQRFELASQITLPKLNLKATEGKAAKLILSRSDEAHLKAEASLDIIRGNAKSGKDYNFSDSFQVIFEPGETQKAIKIPILKDKRVEKKETFTVQVQAGDRTYIQEKNAIKISILDISPKGRRAKRSDALLGDESIAVGKEAVNIVQRSDRPSRPFDIEENQPAFAQTFDINLFTGTGSHSWGHDAPESVALFAPNSFSEVPFASAGAIAQLL